MWIVFVIEFVQASATVPSAPAAARRPAKFPMPGKVCVSPKSPLGGALRTDTFSPEKPSFRFCVHATMRSPLGRTRTFGSTDTRSGGESACVLAYWAAPAPGAKPSASAMPRVERPTRMRFMRFTSRRP
jgi:hypothetical protein